IQRWRVAMATTMLTTITAPPMIIVKVGARRASNAAVISHANTNVMVAITDRTSRDSLGLATATASASKLTTSVNGPNNAIEEVIAAGAPRDGTDRALHLGDEPPDVVACRSYILPQARGRLLNGDRCTALIWTRAC